MEWREVVRRRGGLADGGIKWHGGRGSIWYCCLSGRGVGERDDWKSWGSKQEVRNKRKKATIRGRDSDEGL